MKYCAYCGRRLEDNEECSCRNENAGSNTQENVNDTVTVEAESTSAEVESNAAAESVDAASQVSQGYYDAIPDAPASGSGKKSLLPVICGIAGAAVVAVIALILVLGGSKSKLYKAAEKTFKDTGFLAEDLKKFKSGGKEYTVSINATASGLSIGASMIVDGKDKQISVQLGKGKDAIGAVAEIGKNALKAKPIGIDYDNVFVYDYTSDINEALEEMVDADRLKELNEALETLYNTETNGASSDKYQKIIVKWLNKIKTKKIDKKSFKVDGEKRDCAGYRVLVNEDILLGMIRELAEELEKESPDMFAAFKYDDVDDLVDDMENQLSEIDFDEINIEAYLYKGMLAAVAVENDGEKSTIEFNGGDYRLQNIRIYTGKKSDGKTLLEASGKTSDKKETYTITIPEQYEITYSYDRSNGKFEVSASQYSYWSDGFSEAFKLKGSIEISRSDVTFTAKSIEVVGTSIGLDKFEIAVSSKASLEEIKGKEFKINSADSADLSGEINELGMAYGQALQDSEFYQLIMSLMNMIR